MVRLHWESCCNFFHVCNKASQKAYIPTKISTTLCNCPLPNSTYHSSTLFRSYKMLLCLCQHMSGIPTLDRHKSISPPIKHHTNNVCLYHLIIPGSHSTQCQVFPHHIHILTPLLQPCHDAHPHHSSPGPKSARQYGPPLPHFLYIE